MMKICLPSELGYEKFAMLAVATVAKQMGFEAKRIDDLKTAVAEAVTNAIEHGNQLNAEIRVLVAITLQETVTLSFRF